MGKSVGTEGKHLRLSEESEVTNLWQTGQSENDTDGPYCGPTCPMGMWVHQCTWAGSWSMGIREQTWGEDCCWLWEYGLRDREGGNLQQGMPMQENQTAMGAGHYC